MDYKNDKHFEKHLKLVDEFETMYKNINENGYSDIQGLIAQSKEIINKCEEFKLNYAQRIKCGFEYLIEYPEHIEFIITYAKKFIEEWKSYYNSEILKLKQKEKHYYFSKSYEYDLINKVLVDIIKSNEHDEDFKLFINYATRLEYEWPVMLRLTFNPSKNFIFQQKAIYILKQLLVFDVLYVKYNIHRTDNEIIKINLLNKK